MILIKIGTSPERFGLALRDVERYAESRPSHFTLDLGCKIMFPKCNGQDAKCSIIMRYVYFVGGFCKSFRPPDNPPPNRFFLPFSADNRKKKNPASVTLTGFCFFFRRLFVELEGVEPSSKRGTNALSTCLVFTWF